MKEIKLNRGFVTLVDDEDFEYLNQWKWSVEKVEKKNNYYVIRGSGPRKKRIHLRMHRIIMNAPKGIQVDHRDQNGLNNQKSNLRFCTNAENQWNRRSYGKSKYLGVYYYKKYIRATIQENNKRHYLGSFKTEVDAAKAYDEVAKKYHGEFANLNFNTLIK